MSTENKAEWNLIKDIPPPEKKKVMTKIDDGIYPRNEQVLIKQGNLYFMDDMSMYVYYTPTHWKPL